jgi:RNA polymerase I-specific transcription initiation factor RRN3
MYCYPILESNKRSEQPSSNATDPSRPKSDTPVLRSSITNRIGKGDLATSELNTFFPFDPCKLPKLGTYIDSVYRDWASVAIEDLDDDDDDSGSENDDSGPDSGDTSEHLGLPFTQRKPSGKDDAELGASFDAMSISPIVHLPNAATSMSATVA